MPTGKYWNLAGQTIAIVASILLAFAIQAWWEDRQQQTDETIVLQSILTDLVQKKAILARDRSYNGSIIQASTRLLEVATDAQTESSEDEIDNLINGFMFKNQESDWASAPLNSLFMGGNVSIISNQPLLQKLASVHVSFNRLRLFYRYDRDFVNNDLMPFVRRHVNQAQLTGITENVPGTDISYGLPAINVSNHYDHSELLSNVEFQNLILARIYSLMDITNFAWLGFAEELDDVISLLEAELAGN